jgi:hypothetical protein
MFVVVLGGSLRTVFGAWTEFLSGSKLKKGCQTSSKQQHSKQALRIPPHLSQPLKLSQATTKPQSQQEDLLLSHRKKAVLQLQTRQQCQIRMLTQDYMFCMMEVQGYTAPFTVAQAASCKYPLQFLCDFACAVLDIDTGDLLEYIHLIKHPEYKDTWSQSFRKEIRCLATTTMTIFFMNKHKIPKYCQGDVTYSRIVCTYHEGKKDKHHTRITMGGNFINNLSTCGTPTADLLTVKPLLNSIISTPSVKFMSIDIKDFYLKTLMTRYKYFCKKVKLFPEDVIEEYNLCNKVDLNGA